MIDSERWAVILDLVDGDPDVLHELVHAFVTDVPIQPEKLRAAVNPNDVGTARTTSHRIKGSGELAYRIEQDSPRGELDSPDPQVDEVAREFERVAAELDRLERS